MFKPINDFTFKWSKRNELLIAAASVCYIVTLLFLPAAEPAALVLLACALFAEIFLVRDYSAGWVLSRIGIAFCLVCAAFAGK